MPSIVFVHGTGVRGVDAGKTLRKLEAGVDRWPGVAVRPCVWGEILGSPGAPQPSLVPGGEVAPARVTDPAERQEATWTRLDLDPLHDLDLLALAECARPKPQRPLLPGEADTAREFDDLVAALPQDEPLAALLDDLRLSLSLPEAAAEVSGSPSTRSLLTGRRVGGAGWPGLAEAVAEAMVARLLRIDPGVDLEPAQRRDLVAHFVDALRGGQLGVVGTMLGQSWELFMRLGGNRVVEHYRAPLNAAASPFVGDILHYLARGELVRSFIADRVAQAEPPVVLVGHSLGGIACLDTLAERRIDGVSALLTVGSQGSQLWEMDALPSLRCTGALPDTLPPWINVYSRHDLLSYLAEPAFPGRVRDEELASVASMPAAHGAYFDDPRLYMLIAGLLQLT